jgi:hypothetical protein
MDGCIDVSTRRTLTVARIAGPGLVGSLVPGYAEAKKLASTASQQAFTTVVGCRIDFAFVSAVTFTMRFNTQAPLLGKRIKDVVQQRGYGESTRFTIGFEFSDGWRPYRAVLVGEHVPLERDGEPLQFATWLARRVAYDRLQRSPQLGEADRELLERVVGGHGELGFRAFSSASAHRQSLRIELPGHRPVSVELGA